MLEVVGARKAALTLLDRVVAQMRMGAVATGTWPLSEVIQKIYQPERQSNLKDAAALLAERRCHASAAKQCLAAMPRCLTHGRRQAESQPPAAASLW